MKQNNLMKFVRLKLSVNGEVRHNNGGRTVTNVDVVKFKRCDVVVRTN